MARNDTILYGWHSECHERGTWSILWGCLATVLVCTWSCLHLDVPRNKSAWGRFILKIRWMLLALMAPEYLLGLAFKNIRLSQKLDGALQVEFSNRQRPGTLISNQEPHKWTSTHRRFALAKGFDFENGNQWKPIYEDDYSKIPEEPPIPEEELKSRSLSDWFTNSLAVFQIVWFAVEMLARRLQHLHITPSEILTLAFISCSLFTYGLCWTQPQNVDFPVKIPGSLGHEETVGSDSALKRFSPVRSSENDGEQNPQQYRLDSEEITMNRHREVLLRRVLTWLLDLGADMIWKDFHPADNALLFLMTFVGTAFGAVHCLAWNSTFPTTGERLAWRVGCLVTTPLPIVFCTCFFLFERWAVQLPFVSEMELKALPKLLKILTPSNIVNLWACTLVFLIGIYAIARAAIIILALMSLRSLPADAFRVTDWNNVIPHVGV